MPTKSHGKTLARISLNKLKLEDLSPLANRDLGYIDGYLNVDDCVVAVFVRMRDGLITTIPLSELFAIGEDDVGRVDYR